MEGGFSALYKLKKPPLAGGFFIKSKLILFVCAANICDLPAC